MFKLLALAMLACAPTFAHATDNNVILITLDGVRWEEVFYGVDSSIDSKDSGPTFPLMFQDLARKQGVLFGDKAKGNPMFVSNSVRISLPAYESILAGRVTECTTNECDRVAYETLQERLLREGKFARDSVATFASWDKIELAAESHEGATVQNCGLRAFDDSVKDAELTRLNREQEANPPEWGDARADKYTWAQAMRYLKVHKPRFLYISLNDSDELAHMGQYRRYLEKLREFDRWINDLKATLRGMGEYGEHTTLIVTTDHGRGEHGDWTDHGPWLEDAKYIWLYGVSPWNRGFTPTTGRSTYSHVDIRPTVEAALGLKPISCDGCGRVMTEIVSSQQ